MIVNNNEIYYSKPDHINTHTHVNVRFQKKIGGKRDFETKKNLSNIYRYLLFTKQNYSTTLHTHTHTQINGKEPAHYFELIDMLKIQMFSF